MFPIPLSSVLYVDNINRMIGNGAATFFYLYVVYALCEGPIQGVGRILINDIELPGPAGGIYALNALHNVDSGRYKGRVKMEFFYGVRYLL